nr:hypothetical protein CFP56_01915 [Quercus suber]
MISSYPVPHWKELHPATYAAAHSVSRASATAPNLKVNHVDSTCGSGCFGLLLLCIQGDAKRFLLEEVMNGETDVKPNNQLEKLSSKGNPISGLVPTIYASNKNKESNTSDKDNHSEDDKNESYKSNGNPSESSTKRHYLYITTCPPTSPYCEKKG